MAESGKAFDYQNPGKSVTSPDDPQGIAMGAPYPKHLYKFGGGKDSVVVAWDGETPISNQVVSVGSPAEEDAAAAKGFGPGPLLKRPRQQ